MIHGHGGNIYQLAKSLGCHTKDITDMSSNVNPFGPPPGLMEHLKERLSSILALPEVDAKKCVQTFSRRYEIDENLILGGNGTTQFIYTIPRALCKKKALILGPAYADYADACVMGNIPFEFEFTKESNSFNPDLKHLAKRMEDFDLIFICNPNNPTGALIPAEELAVLCKSHPEKIFVIDESYLPFVRGWKEKSMAGKGLPNVVALNSMSKIFRVPGLRIGFLVSSPWIVEKLKFHSLPWNVNSLAQAAVVFLMERQKETEEFIDKTVSFLETEKSKFAKIFKNHPDITLFPSNTSFVLGQLSEKHTAESVCEALSREKILIRNCSNFQGLSERFIRISLKGADTNRKIAEKLLIALKGKNINIV